MHDGVSKTMNFVVPFEDFCYTKQIILPSLVNVFLFFLSAFIFIVTHISLNSFLHQLKKKNSFSCVAAKSHVTFLMHHLCVIAH